MNLFTCATPVTVIGTPCAVSTSLHTGSRVISSKERVLNDRNRINFITISEEYVIIAICAITYDNITVT